MNRLKIGDAAFVIDSSVQMIQKWLMKPGVALPLVRPEKGEPATFGDADLMFFRLMSVMIEFGARIETAASLVNAIFRQANVKLTDEEFDLKPWEGKVIIVTRRKDAKRGDKFSWSAGIWPDDEFTSYPAALVLRPHDLFSEVLSAAQLLKKRRAA